MKIRLLDKRGACAHEFTQDPNTGVCGFDANTILIWEPTGKHYVYRDAGDDEDGGWEEWTEAELVTVHVTLHSELTGDEG